MISHAACDHESSSKARARCRKARKALEDDGTASSGDGATIITIDFTERKKVEEGYGYYNARTPRDKEMECMICRVYPYLYRGEDEHGRLLYCCSSCSWRLLDKVLC